MLAQTASQHTATPAGLQPVEAYKIARVRLRLGPLANLLENTPRVAFSDRNVFSEIEQMFPEPKVWPGDFFDVLLTRFHDGTSADEGLKWDPTGFGAVHPRLLASTLCFHQELAKKFGPLYLVGSQEGQAEDDEADPKVGQYVVAKVTTNVCSFQLMTARDIDKQDARWYAFSVGRWSQ